jgi:hypothetical protein
MFESQLATGLDVRLVRVPPHNGEPSREGSATVRQQVQCSAALLKGQLAAGCNGASVPELLEQPVTTAITVWHDVAADHPSRHSWPRGR